MVAIQVVSAASSSLRHFSLFSGSANYMEELPSFHDILLIKT